MHPSLLLSPNAAAAQSCASPLTHPFPRPPSRTTLPSSIKTTQHSYGGVAPAAVENFAALALGRTPGGVGYRGAAFHRVVEGFMIQGGDVVHGDGTGTFTVWDGAGGKFKDENLGALRHTKGALSLANTGPDSNGCQFFITVEVRASSARE